MALRVKKNRWYIDNIWYLKKTPSSLWCTRLPFALTYRPTYRPVCCDKQEKQCAFPAFVSWLHPQHLHKLLCAPANLRVFVCLFCCCAWPQGLRVGGPLSLAQARKVNVEQGCSLPDPCGSSPCPVNSYCSDNWDSYSCTCLAGQSAHLIQTQKTKRNKNVFSSVPSEIVWSGEPLFLLNRLRSGKRIHILYFCKSS